MQCQSLFYSYSLQNCLMFVAEHLISSWLRPHRRTKGTETATDRESWPPCHSLPPCIQLDQWTTLVAAFISTYNVTYLYLLVLNYVTDHNATVHIQLDHRGRSLVVAFSCDIWIYRSQKYIFLSCHTFRPFCHSLPPCKWILVAASLSAAYIVYVMHLILCHRSSMPSSMQLNHHSSSLYIYNICVSPSFSSIFALSVQRNVEGESSWLSWESEAFPAPPTTILSSMEWPRLNGHFQAPWNGRSG